MTMTMGNLQTLATITKRYRAHNDRVAEGHSKHVEKCTTVELEYIVQDTQHKLAKAFRRITRLEEKLNIKADPSDY
jgi:hypothetical protein